MKNYYFEKSYFNKDTGGSEQEITEVTFIDNKSSLFYLAHSRDFLNRLLRKEAFNLGSVKNKINPEESRDGKKHKISAMIDTYISLRHL